MPDTHILEKKLSSQFELFKGSFKVAQTEACKLVPYSHGAAVAMICAMLSLAMDQAIALHVVSEGIDPDGLKADGEIPAEAKAKFMGLVRDMWKERFETAQKG